MCICYILKQKFDLPFFFKCHISNLVILFYFYVNNLKHQMKT